MVYRTWNHIIVTWHAVGLRTLTQIHVHASPAHLLLRWFSHFFHTLHMYGGAAWLDFGNFLYLHRSAAVIRVVSIEKYAACRGFYGPFANGSLHQCGALSTSYFIGAHTSILRVKKIHCMNDQLGKQDGYQLWWWIAPFRLCISMTLVAVAYNFTKKFE